MFIFVVLSDLFSNATIRHFDVCVCRWRHNNIYKNSTIFFLLVLSKLFLFHLVPLCTLALSSAPDFYFVFIKLTFLFLLMVLSALETITCVVYVCAVRLLLFGFVFLFFLSSHEGKKLMTDIIFRLHTFLVICLSFTSFVCLSSAAIQHIAHICVFFFFFSFDFDAAYTHTHNYIIKHFSVIARFDVNIAN